MLSNSTSGKYPRRAARKPNVTLGRLSCTICNCQTGTSGDVAAGKTSAALLAHLKIVTTIGAAAARGPIVARIGLAMTTSRALSRRRFGLGPPTAGSAARLDIFSNSPR